MRHCVNLENIYAFERAAEAWAAIRVARGFRPFMKIAAEIEKPRSV